MKSIFYLFIAITISLSSSCKKPVEGCTDIDADNFDALAEEDNGTCYFSGGAVFYHNLAGSQYLLDNGIPYARVLIDNVSNGVLSANVHWSFIPSCSSEDAITIQNYGLAYQKSKQFNYRVEEPDGSLLDAGTFMIRANSCEAILLNY